MNSTHRCYCEPRIWSLRPGTFRHIDMCSLFLRVTSTTRIHPMPSIHSNTLHRLLRQHLRQSNCDECSITILQLSLSNFLLCQKILTIYHRTMLRFSLNRIMNLILNARRRRRRSRDDPPRRMRHCTEIRTKAMYEAEVLGQFLRR